MDKFKKVIQFIRELFNEPTNAIFLHKPMFIGNEKKYLLDCIDSTFVSSVGKYVNRIEKDIVEYTGAKYAVATVNGTAALHIALLMAGVNTDDEVITQSLTFIATANAISYCDAKPIFLDVDKNTMGLSPNKLEHFLKKHTKWDSLMSKRLNILTNKHISACVPMHTFGHPCRIGEIIEICNKYNIPVVEDSAESIGSLYKKKMTGTFGKLGIYSFNGNKTMTCGGGGIIITDDEELAKKAKHITTTAKVPHKWEYRHDMIGYNYRMPNINAALACAQLEQLDNFIESKRKLAQSYSEYFNTIGIEFVKEPEKSHSNYWLNTIILRDKKERDEFLKYTNENGIMSRPIWILMNKLEMFKNCQTDELTNSHWLEERIVNIPSSVKI
ncbi:MAG: LegC family aminotransferase [Candidatus Cloacimonetes bacterium]|nr:LegC family aminotransferase [Candidatus Cloacimonadota bacterium]